jgi:hypothetical protein
MQADAATNQDCWMLKHAWPGQAPGPCTATALTNWPATWRGPAWQRSGCPVTHPSPQATSFEMVYKWPPRDLCHLSRNCLYCQSSLHSYIRVHIYSGGLAAGGEDF